LLAASATYLLGLIAFISATQPKDAQ